MSEFSYKPLISDMVWSYSRAKSFDDCPYKWYLKYIRLPNEPQKEQFFANYGKFMHELIADFRSKKKNVSQVKAEYLIHFCDKVLGAAPSGKIYNNYFLDGLGYLETLTEGENKILQVEEKFETEIFGKPFIGYIDLVEETTAKEIILIDNKSRALKPRSKRKKPTKSDNELDDYFKQLYIYSMAVNEQYGRYPAELVFNCYRTKTQISEQFSEEKCAEALEWLSNTMIRIENEIDFYPDLEFFKCRYLCEMQTCCEYFTLNNKGGASYKG